MQWSGWGIESGNFGYLRLLEELGISVATLQMTEKEVQEALNSSGTSSEAYNPHELLERRLW